MCLGKGGGTQDKAVLGFRVSYESQGPDLNRRGFRSAGGCVGPDSATLAHSYLWNWGA